MVRIYASILTAFALLWAEFSWIMPSMVSAPDSVQVILGWGQFLVVFLPIELGVMFFIATKWRTAINQATKIGNAVKNAKPILVLLAFTLTLVACSRVPVGDYGVKVDNLGDNRGVEATVIDTGYVWVGWNSQLILFPASMIQVQWSASKHEGGPVDTSMGFGDKNGVVVVSDFALAYSFDKNHIRDLVIKYRQDPDQIRDKLVRNEVRDSLQAISGSYDIDQLMGDKKEEFLSKVNARIKTNLGRDGIIIDKLFSIGQFEPASEQIRAARDSKIHAIQVAEQKENELRQAKADAAKVVAAAQGEADSQIVKAVAQAQANDKINASLTPGLLQYLSIQKWDGKLPQATGQGGAVPFLNLSPPKG